MADRSSAGGRNPKNEVPPKEFHRVKIFHSLHEKLLNLYGTGMSRALVYGFGFHFDNFEWCECPTAIAIMKYPQNDSLALARARRYLPQGLTLMGLVEFGEKDEDEDIISTTDFLEYPVLFKVSADKINCYTGLDFLKPVELDIISERAFWKKEAAVFRLTGKLLLTSLLEVADLKECFALARARVNNKAAYLMGNGSSVMILPPSGDIVAEGFVVKPNSKVIDMTKSIKAAYSEEITDKGMTYFSPEINIIGTKILFDQAKLAYCNSMKQKHSAVVIADKSACCKYFEHYMDLDIIVVVPAVMRVNDLYATFDEAVNSQLEAIFTNINDQLENSITAEKPEIFHFWPSFGEHFITAVYSQNTSEEKQKDIRHDLHDLLYIRENRPYFRRSASLFQSYIGLVSPHLSLTGKFEETDYVKGHYEYRHYMQENFNDDGWGCAYRSLQTIVSWFRIQGFTSSKVPTHREIQECLVSLGDKPSSFVGSKQWIGSTEVAFVLEALLGISCRIVSMSSGGEMASRVSELQSHFKHHGTPVMIGGGVLAHTIIGTSREPDSDSNVNYLVLDPHYTGKDDLKAILSKGWVGWKENSFWSKKDFYNMCMPLLPAAI